MWGKNHKPGNQNGLKIWVFDDTFATSVKYENEKMGLLLALMQAFEIYQRPWTFIKLTLILNFSKGSDQLGTNHICVILSHRHDTITSVWYYVSHRPDT